MALSNVMTRSLISASSSMKQVKAQHAIKSQMEGKAGVLEAEIKQDSGRGGDVTKKKEIDAKYQAKRAERAAAVLSFVEKYGNQEVKNYAKKSISSYYEEIVNKKTK